MTEKNNYPDFRSELKLSKAKTKQEIEKLAFNENTNGNELVSSLYDDVEK
jgi:hypothetical protein